MTNQERLGIVKEWLERSGTEYTESYDGVLWEDESRIVCIYSRPRSAYGRRLYGVAQKKSGDGPFCGMMYFNEWAINYFIERIKQKLNEENQSGPVQ